MNKEREEIIDGWAKIHETELKDEDYLINYDPHHVMNNPDELKSLILKHVSTTGSALGAGKYAGHGFSLSWYGEFDGCEWLVKKHIDWNHNVSHILIPVRKGVITFPDDVEKIDMRNMLQKIHGTTSSLGDVQTHIGYLLNRYPAKTTE